MNGKAKRCDLWMLKLESGADNILVFLLILPRIQFDLGAIHTHNKQKNITRSLSFSL
jgi:hypothetical protein